MKPAKIDGRVSRAQKQRETRRAAMLKVARRIFARKGFHATSIDQLIADAGIARGTFYLYFESKRAIFDELLDELTTALATRVHRIDISPGAPPPIEQLNAIVDQVLGTLVENRDIARILLREAVGIDADFDRKLSEFYGRIEDMTMRAIRNGQAMGLVRQSDATTVTVWARCILGAVKEVVQYAIVDPDAAGMGAPDVERIRKMGREVIAFTLTGLFRTP
jgi:AcrR family transcriptional regulator